MGISTNISYDFLKEIQMSGKLDLTIEQGASFSKRITLTDEGGQPIDVSLDTFAGQVRKRHQSGVAQATFAITIINGVGGELVVELSAGETAAMESGDSVYDIEWTKANGAVTRLLEGNALVTPEVTR